MSVSTLVLFLSEGVLGAGSLVTLCALAETQSRLHCFICI